MQIYDYVFVVLVYKNTDVLKSFFESLDKVSNKKIILVNSFYDEDSELRCHEIASNNNADFISVPNRGFGAGNNRGIEYAKEHYNFKYLILSNSDIIINNFEKAETLPKGACVVAPYTRLLTGKAQNPNVPKEPKFTFWLLKKYLVKERNIYLHCAHIISRSQRELFLLFSKIVRKERYKIFSFHGSFIILSALAIEELMPVFDERIFLYNEEGYLASKCKYLNIPCYFCPRLRVTHLEGASSKKTSVSEENKKSLAILLDVRLKSDYFHGVDRAMIR